MRSIKIAFALVFVAASAHAEPAVYPGLIPDYQKLEPSGAYVFNATDGQWHANSSTNPLYCSVTSGGNGGTVDLTKLNGSTPSAANPLPAQLSDGSAAYTAAKTGQLPAALDGSGYFKVHEQGTATVSGTVTANQGTAGSAPWPVRVEWNAALLKATTRSTISNSQANSSLTTGCTGACASCQVCNIGTTNPICVKTASGSTGPILYPRAAATTPPMCYAFSNVTNIYADSNDSGCAGGSDVEITCEDDG